MSEPVYLLISIDVEEEGLFRNRFPRKSAVRNTAFLRRLEPLLSRFSLPVTLFCDYPVLTDAPSCRAIDELREKARVEVGAHLHHWNTPPFSDGDDAKDGDDAYVSPDTLPPELFRQRMDALFTAGRAYAGQALTSFRMGRWHLYRQHWPQLAASGVLVDASVRPLYRTPTSPDFFNAPTEPYSITVNGHAIIESPCTGLPLYPALPRHLCSLESAGGTTLSRAIQYRAPLCGLAWGLMPVYLSLGILRWVAGRYLARGGRFLSLTWHSSEMMPGGTPHLPDEASIDALLTKIEAFCAWLHRHYSVQGLVLDDLRSNPHVAPLQGPDEGGDWRPTLAL